jgi:hypothetical protein
MVLYADSENSGAQWQRSTRCEHSACVEVRIASSDRIGIRDGKDPSGPALFFDAAQWSHFIHAIKCDELTP